MRNSSDIAAVAECRTALEIQRSAFNRQPLVKASERRARLKQARRILLDNRNDIIAAVDRDFGQRSRHETLASDLLASLSSIKHNASHLRRWMRKGRRYPGWPAALFGARAEIEYQPRGVIGIIGSWHFPISSIFIPMASALAAGNRVMVLFSEETPATAELLNTLLAEYFDPKEVCGIAGGPKLTEAFASQPFDYLVYTGSERVGRQVLRAAADHLVPVTLQLAGKCPVVIGRDCDIDDAALKIMAGKALNAGQANRSPESVYVPAELLGQFTERCKAHASRLYPHILQNRDFSSLANEQHYHRLEALLQEARDAGTDIRVINPAGEDFSAQQGVFKMPLTLVVQPDTALGVMQEQLFGPVLCIRSYRLIDECFEELSRMPRAPALYYFGDNRYEMRRVLDHTHSGGVSVNDVMADMRCKNLPLSGLGNSGIGHFQGREAFLSMSHGRGIYYQSRSNPSILADTLPPYSDRCEKHLNGQLR